MRLLRAVLPLAVAAGLAAVSGAVTAQAGPDVPPVSDAARSAGFVDVRTVVSDAIIDLRYATTNNFTGTQLYPSDARCLVHQSMAPGLAAAATALRPQGHLLVFWDCYRPHDVQVKMFNVVPNPAWVARPGQYAHSHESGRSVDVTFTSEAAAVRVRATRGRALPGRHGHRLRRLHLARKRFRHPGRQRGRPGEPGRAAERDEVRRAGRCTPGSGGISTARAPGSTARSSTSPSTSHLIL